MPSLLFTCVVAAISFLFGDGARNQFLKRKVFFLLLPNLIYFLLMALGADEVIVRHSIHLAIPIIIGVYSSVRFSKIDSEVEKAG